MFGLSVWLFEYDCDMDADVSANVRDCDQEAGRKRQKELLATFLQVVLTVLYVNTVDI